MVLEQRVYNGVTRRSVGIQHDPAEFLVRVLLNDEQDHLMRGDCRCGQSHPNSDLRSLRKLFSHILAQTVKCLTCGTCSTHPGTVESIVNINVRQLVPYDEVHSDNGTSATEDGGLVGRRAARILHGLQPHRQLSPLARLIANHFNFHPVNALKTIWDKSRSSSDRGGALERAIAEASCIPHGGISCEVVGQVHDNQWNCPECNRPRPALKVAHAKSAPSCLVISISRHVVDAGVLSDQLVFC